MLGPLESDARPLAWILYSVSLASGSGPASFAAISSVADGINHAVPTQQEMASSLRWLRSRGLVVSMGKRHALAEPGRLLVGQAQVKASTVSAVWAHLAEGIRGISAGA